MTLDALLATPRVYGASLSPDKRNIVWTWANIGPIADIYTMPIDGSTGPRKLTDFGQDTGLVSWTLDGTSIVVAHDYDGDERTRLYKVEIRTGTITPLTEEHPTYFIRGGKIHPNGKYLFYGATYDFEKDEPVEALCIYRHDLETGERKVLARPQKHGGGGPQLNVTGTHVIYSRSDLDPAGRQIWMVDIDGKEDREILNFGARTKVGGTWHHNGTDIVFVVEDEHHRRVGIYDTRTGDIHVLLDDASRNVEDAVVPYQSPYLVIDEIEQARTKITLLDCETKKEEPFNGPVTTVPIGYIADNRWLVVSYDATQPGAVALFDAKTSTIERVLIDPLSHAGYAKEDLVQAEDHTWTSVDGLKIHGWLYRPKGEVRGTVVLVHGGPTAHSEDAFDVDVQYYLSRGFVVLDPNYRGSTGYGLDFEESIKKEGWGGAEQEDIRTGIQSLIDAGIAQKGKVAITGTSYGGYSAWHAITHFSTDEVAAAAPICGMTDLVVDYETTRPDLRGYSEEMLGGTPAQAPERYKEASPIHFIQNIRGKLLIVQGMRDPNVTPANVYAVEGALRAHNIEYEKLVFDDEGHGITKPENQKVLLEKTADFFESVFGQS